MKKIYIAPSAFSIELRATKMMALSYSDQEITDGNYNEYDQDAREDINNNNRYSIWDNAW